MNSNKNILLAIALSAAVLFLWQYFVATPSMKAEQARQQQLAKQTGASKPAPAPSTAPGNAPGLPGIASSNARMTRSAALKAAPCSPFNVTKRLMRESAARGWTIFA